MMELKWFSDFTMKSSPFLGEDLGEVSNNKSENQFALSIRTFNKRENMGKFKLDKNAFQVSSIRDESDEKSYWLSKTPEERLQAMELMRQINYGYNPITARLQRVLEVVKRK
jgi:hypothetical protein